MKLRPNALGIVRGEGVHLYDEHGKAYIDAVSSWWVNLHGHSHPQIAQAIYQQAQTLAHCMFANLTHEPAVQLAERLLAITPGEMRHVFYSDNGSCATEIAIKMALQAFTNRAQPRRTIVALADGYHGDTFGAMSASGRGLFTEPFDDKLFNVAFIPAPTRERAAESLAALQKILTNGDVAALIVEPLVQGAAGMAMYDPEYLRLARQLCDRYEVHLICDEIAVGCGRTGTFFAHEQADIRPDLMCLSKGISGGYLPLSIVLCSDTIYAAFLDDSVARAFLHSHSYTGNPLACRAALATLDIFDSDDVLAVNLKKSQKIGAALAPLAGHPQVRHLRQRGMIAAFDVARQAQIAVIQVGGGAD